MKTTVQSISTKSNFNKAGYFLLILIPLVIFGFWNTYFSKFASDINGVPFYFHFHAALMMIWLSFLIIQPILISRKKLAVHRLIGKVSYFIMPLIPLSILLMFHVGEKATPIVEQTFVNEILPLRELLVLPACFILAVVYRRNTNIHARAMIATGIALIDPALARLLAPVFATNLGLGIFILNVIVLGTLGILIVLERKQKSARWIFPSQLGIYAVTYGLLISQIFIVGNPILIPPLDSLVRWYLSLPLT